MIVVGVHILTHKPSLRLVNNNQKKNVLFPGSGYSTALIRVFAALGLATELKTLTSDACKLGLTRSVDTGRPLAECLTESGKEILDQLPKDHYLNHQKYF